MDSIVAQIQAIAQNTDEAGRLNIIRALKQVKVDLQSSHDTFLELAVPVRGHLLQLGVASSADSYRD
jgi:hypothetical protein